MRCLLDDKMLENNSETDNSWHNTTRPLKIRDFFGAFAIEIESSKTEVRTW